MDNDRDRRIAAIAERGAANLRAGGTVHDVLRSFREQDGLGAIEAIIALRAIEQVSLSAAKLLVTKAWSGADDSYLDLAALQYLARARNNRAADSWLHGHLESAIIDGRP